MAVQVYRIATVQLVVRADNEAEVADAISETLGEWLANPQGIPGDLLDWNYLRLGGQYLYGTEAHFDPDTYEEGDFLGR